MSDPSKISHYFARADGRVAPSYRPSCLGPLRHGVELISKPRETASVLGQYFEEKVTAQVDGNTLTARRHEQDVMSYFGAAKNRS